MRLFIAVNFSEPVRDSLTGWIQKLKDCGASGNFSRRENLHLTLAFIGETDKVEKVRQAMDKVSAEPFALTVGGLGRFRRNGGDICWAGVEKNEALLSVHNQLCSALRLAGFPIENREFKPHLTLGREVVFPSGFSFRDFAGRIAPMTEQVWKISLMKSERIGGKLTYTEIYEKRLEPRENR
ncbi:MAG: RNA 2',3'-cyclic phosphodiesterase [Clostridiales bacterium]|jgi:RNA 2',3'-cyclic 3'-phosphodiesterase|nr:RNA 2',3'-cyclic phosphodiesterase [Clostridiales bacterium]